VTITTIGLDADDTLWHSEGAFELTQAMFRELVAPFVSDQVDLDARLVDNERRNLELFGFGVKGFVLSMIETAIEVTGGQVSAREIQHIIERGKAMIANPVELIDGVADTVHSLSHRYKLMLITKGDLIHQEQKVARSGLADLFAHVEIVSEKDPQTYRRVLDRHGVAPAEFVMVGNSVRSDVLPVLAIGGAAVHVPYELTWAHEVAEHDGTVPTLASLRDLPAWLDRLR
jgi:putative hydrolase of the HAD superfamily